MKKFFIAMTLFSVLFLQGCMATSTRINKLKVSTSDAPEVHGYNTNLAVHSDVLKINGKINISSRENVSISKKENEEYEMGGIKVAGKLDYLHKINTLILGLGLGIDDGIYHHFTLGWNFTHFEFGGFIGSFHQYGNVQYDVERCIATEKQNTTLDGIVLWSNDVCTSYIPYNKNKSEFNSDLFIGLFAGVFIDDFFYNYSLSYYYRDIDIEGERHRLAAVTSHYFTIGYKLNEQFEFTVGGVVTEIGDKVPKRHIGFNGSVSYNLKL